MLLLPPTTYGLKSDLLLLGVRIFVVIGLTFQ
jgi:hypothetical protein